MVDPDLGPGGVLALDLSSMVGWAYGGLFAPLPRFGCWALPHDGGEGKRYAAFENELAAAIQVFAPARLVLEAALSLQAMAGSSTIAVARQQLTLRGIAYSEAYRAALPISEISTDIVRFSVLGTARFKKGTVKAVVVRYCHSRGWKVPDHNAADACVLWAWHTTQLRGGAPVAGRLFAEGLT